MTGDNERYRLGNVKDSELGFDLFRRLGKNRVDNNKICNECRAKFLCGGNCDALSDWYYGDISAPDIHAKGGNTNLRQ